VNLANQLYNFRFDDQELLNFRKVDNFGRRNATENARKTSYHSNIKTDIISDIEFYLRRDRRLVVNFFEYIRFWLGCLLCAGRKRKEKKAMYKTAIHNLTQDLDLLYILRSLQEFEKLKNLLFDKNQLMLFNFTPKPTITNKSVENFHTVKEMQRSKNDVPRELTRIQLSPEETQGSMNATIPPALLRKKNIGRNDWFNAQIKDKTRLFEGSKNYTEINTYKDLLRSYFLLKKRRSLQFDSNARGFYDDVNQKLTVRENSLI
jgi:hypothetical protein